MVDAVQAGRGVVDYPGIYPIANNTVLGNISGGVALPVAIPIASITYDLDVGTTTITGGATGRLLYDNAGVLGEFATTISGSDITFPGRVLVADGSVSLPSYSFGSNSNSGFYLGTNQVVFAGNAGASSAPARVNSTGSASAIQFSNGTDSNGFLQYNTNASMELYIANARSQRFSPTGVAYGAVDAAAPVAQTLSVQNVVAGTTNTAGVDWTHKASAGTGTGVPGRYIVQLAAIGTTGSTQNSFINTLLLNRSGALGSTGVMELYSDSGANSRRLTMEAGTTSANIYSNWSSGSIPFSFGSGTVQWTVTTAGNLVGANNYIAAQALRDATATTKIDLTSSGFVDFVAAQTPRAVTGYISGAPAGGTAATWKFGVAAVVSPTSPNRTIELDVGGTIYYLAAKTTNN